MADVQKEKGYTAIANELLEAIYSAGFTAMEYRILFAIIRQTYGYQKIECEMSLGTISNSIKYKAKPHISTAVTHLLQINVIQLVRMNGQTRVLKINKDYDTWKISGYINGNSYGNGNSTVTKSVTEGLPNREQILYKEKIKKNKENIYSADDYKNSNSFQNGNSCQNDNSNPKQDDFATEFEELWKLYPRKLGKSKVTKKAMKELKSAGVETIKKAIENYKASINKFRTKEQYIMHGSTFFNGGWKDYVESEVTENDNPYANIGSHL